jgi:phenylpropionate dioxygenase-like ring-hydroxylating dioxygenase large terminal subunit
MWGDIGEGSGSWSERGYRKFLPRAEHLDDAGQKRWLYFKMWPNVAFDIYPDQVDFMQFLPISAAETMIREISYALPDDRREMKAARYLNWRINRLVNAEDAELVARVQAGMESASYLQGPLGASEVCLRAFAGKLRVAVPAARNAVAPERGWFRGQSAFRRPN